MGHSIYQGGHYKSIPRSYAPIAHQLPNQIWGKNTEYLSVSHIKRELTRNEIVRGRKVMAGTQTVDGLWSLLKDSVTKHKVRYFYLEAYIREFQWKHNAHNPYGLLEQFGLDWQEYWALQVDPMA